MESITREKAIRLAMDALYYLRNQKYAVGYNAYCGGHEDVWTKRDSEKYLELSHAIESLNLELMDMPKWLTPSRPKT